MRIAGVVGARVHDLATGQYFRVGAPSEFCTFTPTPANKNRGRMNFYLTLPTMIQRGAFVVLRGTTAEAHDGAEHQLTIEVAGPDNAHIGQRLTTMFTSHSTPPSMPTGTNTPHQMISG